MSRITTTNPGAISTKNRRDIQKEWRKRPEYRAASDAFLVKHQWCEVWLAVGIKVPATEIHHPNRWSYQHGFEVYVDFANNGAMAVSGRKGGGHYACHNSLKVCPLCKAKKCNQHAEGCQACLKEKYPGLAAILEQDKLKKKEALQAGKDLRKKLRKEESERVKKWKKEHPIKKVKK